MNRIISWFSCGAASAVATKLAIKKYGDAVVPAYCDVGSEHPDNERFIRDCEDWFGRPITRLKSPKYKDTWDVWEKRKYIKGPNTAPCTSFLKVDVRKAFQQPDDGQVFGYTAGEEMRAWRFKERNEDVKLICPLIDNHLTKADCLAVLDKHGIELPVMYKMGYRNNNCIGCVKGGKGYWNKIRRDFPEVFKRMCKLEETVGATIFRNPDGSRLPLRELNPFIGRYEAEEDEGCGIMCQLASDDIDLMKEKKEDV